MTGLAFPKPVTVRKAPQQLRRTPMRRTNPKRRAKLYTRNYGERGNAVREMSCLLNAAGGCWGPIEAAHSLGRGMGGMNGDRRHLVPMCRGHHRISGALATSDFVARYKIDLHAEAERIAAELDACGIP